MNLSLEKVKFNNATLSAILDEQKFKIYCLRERKKQIIRNEWKHEGNKKRKLESTIIQGRPQKIFQGGNVDILFIIFKLLTINVPSKIILHWANICFSEHDYFRAEKVEFSMNYQLCGLYNKYTISSKYEENNISFK